MEIKIVADKLSQFISQVSPVEQYVNRIGLCLRLGTITIRSSEESEIFYSLHDSAGEGVGFVSFNFDSPRTFLSLWHRGRRAYYRELLPDGTLPAEFVEFMDEHFKREVAE